jgi:PAS domain S-box-containing protein
VNKDTQQINPMPKPIQKSAIIETIDEMILATDDRGVILYANPATLRRSRFEESEVLGQPVEHLFEFSDSQIQQIFQKPAGGSIADMTASAICKDGSSFAVQISMSRLPVAVGQPGLIFVAMDITRIRKRLDEQARLITAVEQAAESIIVTDSNGLVQYVNPAFEEITGYLSSEIIGHRTDLIDSESHKRSFYQSIRDTLLRGDIWQGRLVIKAKDGAMCETETTISPVKNAGGEITNHVHVQRDVTHEVRLEQQLRQAQKMEAIGTLAGGIAHDFNNLLMGIQGNVSLSLLEVDASTGFYQNLKKIEQLVQNGVDLTKQLLGFARGGKYEISVVDMNQLLKEQNLMFGRTNKEVIFDGHYTPTLWRVEVDRGQIEQVLMNLYLNALQAMPGGGTLLVRTENVTIDQDQYRPYHVKAGQYIKIKITDSGVGMDERTQQRIFDPFFTTKEMGRGTGLGLASVYGIVKNHEGFINVTSQIDKGAEFEIYLPATEEAVTEQQQAVETFYEGQGTVLLVDDEAMILDVGQRMLHKLGYHVFTATDGAEALEVYAKNQGRIDVTILDMVMPRLNGGDTFDQIKALNSKAKVLLSSGYSINGQAQEILNRGCDGFIQKPFNMQSLSRNIRMVLDKKQSLE